MSQGGGAPAGGGAVPAAGGGGGGGGSKFLDILKSVGIPVGLGALASGSPLAAMGVRTGLGAYNMFSQNRRQRKLSDLMAEYYGGGAGSKEEAPSNAGDPAFGSEPGKFDLGLKKTDLSTEPGGDRSFGLGGGDQPIDQTFGVQPPGMMDKVLTKNKISELLAAKAPKAAGDGGMGHDEYLARMAAAGGLSPMQLESIRAREEATKTSDQRYNESTKRYEEGKTTSDARYAETQAYRESTDERAARAADRADEGLELQNKASERAERADGRNAANMAADNSRSERAAEMAEEKFAVAKAHWEESQNLDAKELSSILTSFNGSLDDFEWQLRVTSDPAEKEAIKERINRFSTMRDEVQSRLEAALGVAIGAPAQAPAAEPDATIAPAASHTPTGRRRYISATGRFE